MHNKYNFLAMCSAVDTSKKQEDKYNFLATCSAVDTPERHEDQYSRVRCANTPTRTYSLFYVTYVFTVYNGLSSLDNLLSPDG